ncbi:hypothetical protein OE749_05895 [Aestuariibacter sp. AA17]|uniref:Integral membrane protein n=1 Tax=Fluctibacter corallii TaxID=2984329 RepID=A0ABT3A6A6_9ALTE|nr:hypothetical protein [Aestuariibacter sp. AA17]MCV2884220.1 hypothetical protein [Aestuariibacter sp. AA17]
MSEQKIVIGGDVNRSLNGDYQFDIKSLFKQAWALTQENKWQILQMLIFVLGLAYLVVMVLLNISGIDDIQKITLEIQSFIDLTLTFLFAPFVTAIMAVAATHSIGGQSKFSHVFSLLSRTLSLGAAALIVSLCIQLGLGLLIIPGLYLMLATSFTLLIVAEKKQGGIAAMILSIKVVNTYLLDFIKLYLLIGLMSLTVPLTLGISLIWVAPMYYYLKGILYRDLFGITVLKQEDSQFTERNESKEESTFDA